MKSIVLLACCAIPFAAADARAEDKGALQLKVVAKKDSYPWGRDASPKDLKKTLEDAAAALKNGGDPGDLPKPPAVDLALRITNVGTEDATICVEGTSNIYELTVKGPGVIDLKPRLAFPAIFRLPRAVTLAPGKSHEIPVKQLSDGRMGVSRWVYWTEPGEYTVAATYQLADATGGKGALLKSEPVKIAVEGK